MKKAFRKLASRFSDQRGFTLIEIMIVITIIGILAVVIAPMMMDLPQKARISKAKQDIAALSLSLNRYNLDNGSYPTTDQGLQALIEKPQTDPAPLNYNESGYLEKKALPKDPWGHDYIYKSPADNGDSFEISSLGPEGKEGGKGVISSSAVEGTGNKNEGK
jgi:general secretion pathway protein G